MYKLEKQARTRTRGDFYRALLFYPRIKGMAKGNLNFIVIKWLALPNKLYITLKCWEEVINKMLFCY